VIKQTKGQIYINLVGSEIWVGEKRSNEAIIPLISLVKEMIEGFKEEKIHPSRLRDLRNSLKKSIKEIDNIIK
jgi:hypothetical protein